MDVGLRQGSALSPLLFIGVMDVISRKASTRDVLRKLMYADNSEALDRAPKNKSRYKTGWEETVCREGGTETDIYRRIQTRANAWRKVDGVIGDIYLGS